MASFNRKLQIANRKCFRLAAWLTSGSPGQETPFLYRSVKRPGPCRELMAGARRAFHACRTVRNAGEAIGW